METIFDGLKKADAKKLRSWWNANTEYYHFVVKMDNCKLYKLVRQTKIKNNESK